MSNKLHFWIFTSLLSLSLIISLVIFFGLRYLPAKLPLFYSLPWGNGQLATHQQFFVIPISIISVTLLNIALSWQLHSSQSFFKKMLLFSSIIIGLIFTITFIKVILNII